MVEKLNKSKSYKEALEPGNLAGSTHKEKNFDGLEQLYVCYVCITVAKILLLQTFISALYLVIRYNASCVLVTEI